MKYVHLCFQSDIKDFFMKELIEYVRTNNPYIGSTIMYGDEIYDYWDEGCTRYVFVNETKTRVVKIPKNEYSKQFNQEEFEIYTNSSEKDRDQMALTQLNNGIIIQEFVMPIKWGGKRLTIPQRLFAESCRNEVGWNDSGELVCFDLDEFKKY